MVIIFLSFIVCIVAIIFLFKTKPNLFLFQLIEGVFGGKKINKEWLFERFVVGGT